MTQPLDAELHQAIANQIAAEARFENAQRRLDTASNPLTRAFGKIGLWAARGDAVDSAEHVDMVSQLRAMEQRAE